MNSRYIMQQVAYGDTLMISALIVLHVVAGTGAVVGMLGALGTKKGSLWHRRLGRLYAISMAAALSLALVVSILTNNVFLLFVGLFSAYFVYTGWRLAVVKDGAISRLDNHLAWLSLASALAMFVYGIYLRVNGESLGVALAVFGVIAFFPAWTDSRLSNWPKGKERIVWHLNRMGGASIATLTAVFVVNVQTDPAFIAWLLPSLCVTPLIMYWSKKASA